MPILSEKSPEEVLEEIIQVCRSENKSTWAERLSDYVTADINDYDYPSWLDDFNGISKALIVGDTAHIFIRDSKHTYQLTLMKQRSDNRWVLESACFYTVCLGCFGDGSIGFYESCKVCNFVGWECNYEFELCRNRDKVFYSKKYDTKAEKEKIKQTIETIIHLWPHDIQKSENMQQYIAPDFQLDDLQIPMTSQQYYISEVVVTGLLGRALIHNPSEKHLINDDAERSFLLDPLPRLAILARSEQGDWKLQTLVQRCNVCKGDLWHLEMPCAACGNTGWGKAGDLKFCRVVIEK